MRILVVGLMMALTLAGCGRRGDPSPPGPAAAVTYPHNVYPAQ
jgi:predicted small lipoprotein YifL